MNLSLFAACGIAVACLSTTAAAQTANSSQLPATNVAAVGATGQAAASAARILPAGTIVVVTPLQEISSKRVALGDRFQFQVVNDVVENGLVVIPRGSTAVGEVTFKTGRAVGGKSGKFDVTFRSVTANGREFPLSGIHRQEGKGNTVGALLGSILISGHSAVMLPGQMVNALIKAPTPY